LANCLGAAFRNFFHKGLLDRKPARFTHIFVIGRYYGIITGYQEPKRITNLWAFLNKEQVLLEIAAMGKRRAG
jgi:hypothetical protein